MSDNQDLKSKILSMRQKNFGEVVNESNEKNDNVSYKAAKTISEASKSVQLSISQLILTDFSSIEKVRTNKSNPESISSLKKVVLGKK